MKFQPIIAILALLSAPSLAHADPNVTKEGNKSIVKREACLKYGGRVTDNDKRYFICEGGKYDGYITSGPVSESEGDDEETGQP